MPLKCKVSVSQSTIAKSRNLHEIHTGRGPEFGADLPFTRASAQLIGSVLQIAELNIQFAIGGMAPVKRLFMRHKWTRTPALMGESLPGALRIETIETSGFCQDALQHPSQN